MASTREEESRLQVRTLVIASVASLVAAIVTSRFWVKGTPIAAALTPVIVTIVSELLHRPTEAIARRVTTERTAILPEGMGAGSPAEHGQEPQPPRVARDLEGEPTQVRVYRRERRGFGPIHAKVVVLTTILAFAIAAAALTLPELIAGQSLGKGDRNTTFFGGRDRDKDEPAEQPQQQTTPSEEEPTETAPTETAPTETVPPTGEPPSTTTEPTPTVPTTPVEPPAQP